MQQKVSPAIIAVAVVLGVLILGVIGYVSTRSSQDTVSKENAPSYAKEMMNKSNSGTPSSYGETYRAAPQSSRPASSYGQGSSYGPPHGYGQAYGTGASH